MAGEEIKQGAETPKADSTTGLQSETESIVERANKAAERLEQANKKLEENMIKQEQLLARQVLGGRADAGQVINKTPDEVAKADATKLLSKYYG